MPYVDYAEECKKIINKGVIYIPPHRVGLAAPYIAAGVKFLTRRGSYGWVWQLSDYEIFDPQKQKETGIATTMRSRLLGRFGWFWVRWFRLLGKWDRFTWWLYRGRCNV